MSLTYISQQLTIYLGSTLYFAGLFGNAMNIFIFSTVENYRTTPCTFFFLISSIYNNSYILVNLTSRLINAIFDINIAQYSVFWCRFQQFSVGYCGLTSATCSCLAVIDQYLVTSKRAYLRQFSDLRRAQKFVLLANIIWFLHGIPVLVSYDISPVTNRCQSNSNSYIIYVPIYILVLQCTVPIIIMSIFGYLTYRNIHSTRVLAEQKADRQLIKMMLIQILLMIISMVPYGIYMAYSIATNEIVKNLDRLVKELLASTVLVHISYFYYVGNFYMFLITSKRFRRTVKSRLTVWHRIHPR